MSIHKGVTSLFRSTYFDEMAWGVLSSAKYTIAAIGLVTYGPINTGLFWTLTWVSRLIPNYWHRVGSYVLSFTYFAMIAPWSVIPVYALAMAAVTLFRLVPSYVGITSVERASENSGMLETCARRLCRLVARGDTLTPTALLPIARGVLDQDGSEPYTDREWNVLSGLRDEGTYFYVGRSLNVFTEHGAIVTGNPYPGVLYSPETRQVTLDCGHILSLDAFDGYTGECDDCID